jgi:hypothetical protein
MNGLALVRHVNAEAVMGDKAKGWKNVETIPSIGKHRRNGHVY